MLPRRRPTGTLLLVVVALTLLPGAKARAEQKEHPRLDPAGIPGSLILCGDDLPSPEAADRFFRLAGEKQGRIVVVLLGMSDKSGKPDAEGILERWRGREPAALTVLRPRQSQDVDQRAIETIGKASAVWLAGGSPEEAAGLLAGSPLGRACHALLHRGGVAGASGPSVGLVGQQTLIDSDSEEASPAGAGLLPDAILEPGPGKTLEAALKRWPHLVGYSVPPKAALLARGRSLEALGEGKVTVHLGAGKNLPAREIVLEGRERLSDLTMLRRAARQRLEGTFPAARPAPPVVPRGTLIIIGGGGMPAGIIDRFVTLAGGKKASIVVLPTAQPGPLLARDRIADAFRAAGAARVTVLPGRTRAEVESPASLAALREATGIWFGGGRQWRFVDAYEGTQALPLMHAVLRRGGVIMGSSAGATIQGEYLCRGSPLGNLEMMCEGYERGLGFLPGVGIDQHFSQRRRQDDMAAFVKAHPQYLGVGIDEATALVVQGHVGEVVGKGKVFFYDVGQSPRKDEPGYLTVPAGGRYDLRARQVLPSK